jgi:uncharacterized protein (DUF58 family)
MNPEKHASAAERLESRFRNWALRRTVQPSPTVTLGWRTLYILPTWFGMAFALLLAILLLAALNYGANMLFAMAFWLGAFFLLAMHRTHRNLLGLTLSARAPPDAFCGETLPWPVVLRQEADRSRYGIALGWSRRPLAVTHLDERTAQVLLPWAAPRRGLLPCPPVVVSSIHPFGLFRVWAYATLAQQALVAPVPLPCPLQPWASSMQDGNESTSIVHSGTELELEGVRPYQSGDAWGRIAWKRSAGREELVSKLIGGAQTSGLVVLSLETLPAADLETRLSWLCAAVLACEAQGLDHALLLGDTKIGAGCGPAHRRQCLMALACHLL